MARGAERANAQSFLNELADVLGVPRPDPTTGDPAREAYVFDTAPACEANPAHTVSEWTAPGPCLRCGAMMRPSDGAHVLWD